MLGRLLAPVCALVCALVVLIGCGNGELHEFRAHPELVQRMLFLPGNPPMLATLGARTEGEDVHLEAWLDVWEVPSGKRVAQLPLPSGLRNLAVSPDGRSLVCGNRVQFLDAKTVIALPVALRVWDVPSLEVRHNLRLKGAREGVDVHYSSLLRWDVDSGTFAQLSGIEESDGVSAVDGAGGWIAVSGTSLGIQLLDAESGDLVRWLDIEDNHIQRQARHRKARALREKVRERLDRAAATVKAAREAMEKAVPATRDAAIAKVAEALRAFEAARQAQLEAERLIEVERRRAGPDITNWGMRFEPGSTRLLSWGQYLGIWLWSLGTGKPDRFLDVHRSRSISYVRFSPDGRWLASAGESPTLILWYRDPEVPELGWQDRQQLTDLGPVSAFAFSPDGEWLAIGLSREPSLRVWRLHQSPGGPEWREARKIPTAVNAVAFDPGSRWLAATGEGRVRLWQVPLEAPKADAEDE